jgi:hypothetical protein
MQSKKLTPKQLAKIGITSEIENDMKHSSVKSAFEQTIKALANTPPISNKEIIRQSKKHQ